MVVLRNFRTNKVDMCLGMRHLNSFPGRFCCFFSYKHKVEAGANELVINGFNTGRALGVLLVGYVFEAVIMTEYDYRHNLLTALFKIEFEQDFTRLFTGQAFEAAPFKHT